MLQHKSKTSYTAFQHDKNAQRHSTTLEGVVKGSLQKTPMSRLLAWLSDLQHDLLSEESKRSNPSLKAYIYNLVKTHNTYAHEITISCKGLLDTSSNCLRYFPLSDLYESLIFLSRSFSIFLI